jgi:integrase
VLWVARPLGLDLVFRTPDGSALDPDNFTHTTYAATLHAGVGRWSPHELRHSAASLLIAQGVPLKVVSETLGHSSIRVTSDVYGHLLEPAKQEAAEAMSAALWGEPATQRAGRRAQQLAATPGAGGSRAPPQSALLIADQATGVTG